MRCIKNLLVIMTAGFLVIGCIRPLEPVLEIRNESLLLKDTFSLAEIDWRSFKPRKDAAGRSRNWGRAGLRESLIPVIVLT